MCDTAHNLTVQVGEWFGIIPREEAALGIESGKTRDIAILSRVGKPVSFVVDEIEIKDGTRCSVCHEKRHRSARRRI